MLDVIRVDTRDMDRGVVAVLANAATRSPTFFEAMKPAARGELKRHKKMQRGPNGERWASRSRASIARAKAEGRTKRPKGPRTKLLGKVATAYSWTATKDGLVGEHKVPWAAVHHEGGTVGHGAQIPRRAFAAFGRTFSDDVREAWLAWVEKDW